MPKFWTSSDFSRTFVNTEMAQNFSWDESRPILSYQLMEIRGWNWGIPYFQASVDLKIKIEKGIVPVIFYIILSHYASLSKPKENQPKPVHYFRLLVSCVLGLVLDFFFEKSIFKKCQFLFFDLINSIIF